VATDLTPLEQHRHDLAPHLALLDAEGAVRDLLCYVGENPNRDGLLMTPRRVVAMLAEMTRGYHEDAGSILDTTFDESCDEMVVMTGVSFTSLCEHHLLPFSGTVTLGYVPNGQVVGISKLARVVDTFACRLQLQERLTLQIATAIQENLEPKGVGVVVRATHGCMVHRGVHQDHSELVTSEMLGVMRTKPEARAEFLSLAYGH
jgi:GTP cyclohydrolase I